MGSEFARYRKLVVTKYHDLALSEADVISCILKHLHDDCKRYLLLHGSLATLEQLERGLVFYDEQLRVLNFHKEAASAKGYPAFGGGKGDPKGKGKDKGNGKNGGKDQPKGDPKGKGERTRATAKVARREISTEDPLPLLLGKVVIRERMGSATTVVSLDTGPEIAGRRRPMRKPV